MQERGFASWGKLPTGAQEAVALTWREDPLPLPAETKRTVLPRGLGRSYGDSCLNAGETLLLTRRLDRLLALDEAAGTLICEAGASLAEVLDVIVPRGFFLPVTPGTKFVTIGGALANDVHGKNHHRVGTFGHAVRRFELVRSDGSRRVCSPAEDPELFRATIGGLGLTGLVTWVELALKRAASPDIVQEQVRFGGLDEFLALSQESAAGWEYTVAWVDCLRSKSGVGRGIFFRGNHADAEKGGPAPGAKRPLTVPFDLPSWVLGKTTVRAFNTLYYHRPIPRGTRRSPYEPFFYPLDRVHAWNRIYGRRGFFQHQCVVPVADGGAAARAMLQAIARAGAGSFLTVLKMFGDKPSVGPLSFPQPGLTLALDFPNDGAATLALLDRLDAIVRAAGGAVYPAKDARMSAANFRAFFPRWRELAAQVDPRFSSSFWRRVAESHA